MDTFVLAVCMPNMGSDPLSGTTGRSLHCRLHMHLYGANDKTVDAAGEPLPLSTTVVVPDVVQQCSHTFCGFSFQVPAMMGGGASTYVRCMLHTTYAAADGTAQTDVREAFFDRFEPRSRRAAAAGEGLLLVGVTSVPLVPGRPRAPRDMTAYHELLLPALHYVWRLTQPVLTRFLFASADCLPDALGDVSAWVARLFENARLAAPPRIAVGRLADLPGASEQALARHEDGWRVPFFPNASNAFHKEEFLLGLAWSDALATPEDAAAADGAPADTLYADSLFALNFGSYLRTLCFSGTVTMAPADDGSTQGECCFVAFMELLLWCRDSTSKHAFLSPRSYAGRTVHYLCAAAMVERDRGGDVGQWLSLAAAAAVAQPALVPNAEAAQSAEPFALETHLPCPADCVEAGGALLCWAGDYLLEPATYAALATTVALHHLRLRSRELGTERGPHAAHRLVTDVLQHYHLTDYTPLMCSFVQHAARLTQLEEQGRGARGENMRGDAGAATRDRVLDAVCTAVITGCPHYEAMTTALIAYVTNANDTTVEAFRLRSPVYLLSLFLLCFSRPLAASTAGATRTPAAAALARKYRLQLYEVFERALQGSRSPLTYAALTAALDYGPLASSAALTEALALQVPPSEEGEVRSKTVDHLLLWDAALRASTPHHLQHVAVPGGAGATPDKTLHSVWGFFRRVLPVESTPLFWRVKRALLLPARGPDTLEFPTEERNDLVDLACAAAADCDRCIEELGDETSSPAGQQQQERALGKAPATLLPPMQENNTLREMPVLFYNFWHSAVEAHAREPAASWYRTPVMDVVVRHMLGVGWTQQLYTLDMRRAEKSAYDYHTNILKVFLQPLLERYAASRTTQRHLVTYLALPDGELLFRRVLVECSRQSRLATPPATELQPAESELFERLRAQAHELRDFLARDVLPDCRAREARLTYRVLTDVAQNRYSLRSRLVPLLEAASADADPATATPAATLLAELEAKYEEVRGLWERFKTFETAVQRLATCLDVIESAAAAPAAAPSDGGSKGAVHRWIAVYRRARFRETRATAENMPLRALRTYCGAHYDVLEDFTTFFESTIQTSPFLLRSVVNAMRDTNVAAVAPELDALAKKVTAAAQQQQQQQQRDRTFVRADAPLEEENEEVEERDGGDATVLLVQFETALVNKVLQPICAAAMKRTLDVIRRNQVFPMALFHSVYIRKDAAKLQQQCTAPALTSHDTDADAAAAAAQSIWRVPLIDDINMFESSREERRAALQQRIDEDRARVLTTYKTEEQNVLHALSAPQWKELRAAEGLKDAASAVRTFFSGAAETAIAFGYVNDMKWLHNVNPKLYIPAVNVIRELRERATILVAGDLEEVRRLYTDGWLRALPAEVLHCHDDTRMQAIVARKAVVDRLRGDTGLLTESEKVLLGHCHHIVCLDAELRAAGRVDKWKESEERVAAHVRAVAWCADSIRFVACHNPESLLDDDRKLRHAKATASSVVRALVLLSNVAGDVALGGGSRGSMSTPLSSPSPGAFVRSSFSVQASSSHFELPRGAHEAAGDDSFLSLDALPDNVVTLRARVTAFSAGGDNRPDADDGDDDDDNDDQARRAVLQYGDDDLRQAAYVLAENSFIPRRPNRSEMNAKRELYLEGLRRLQAQRGPHLPTASHVAEQQISPSLAPQPVPHGIGLTAVAAASDENEEADADAIVTTATPAAIAQEAIDDDEAAEIYLWIFDELQAVRSATRELLFYCADTPDKLSHPRITLASLLLHDLRARLEEERRVWRASVNKLKCRYPELTLLTPLQLQTCGELLLLASGVLDDATAAAAGAADDADADRDGEPKRGIFRRRPVMDYEDGALRLSALRPTLSTLFPRFVVGDGASSSSFEWNLPLSTFCHGIHHMPRVQDSARRGDAGGGGELVKWMEVLGGVLRSFMAVHGFLQTPPLQRNMSSDPCAYAALLSSASAASASVASAAAAATNGGGAVKLSEDCLLLEFTADASGSHTKKSEGTTVTMRAASMQYVQTLAVYSCNENRLPFFFETLLCRYDTTCAEVDDFLLRWDAFAHHQLHGKTRYNYNAVAPDEAFARAVRETGAGQASAVAGTSLHDDGGKTAKKGARRGSGNRRNQKKKAEESSPAAVTGAGESVGHDSQKLPLFTLFSCERLPPHVRQHLTRRIGEYEQRWSACSALSRPTLLLCAAETGVFDHDDVPFLLRRRISCRDAVWPAAAELTREKLTQLFSPKATLDANARQRDENDYAVRYAHHFNFARCLQFFKEEGLHSLRRGQDAVAWQNVRGADDKTRYAHLMLTSEARLHQQLAAADAQSGIDSDDVMSGALYQVNRRAGEEELRKVVRLSIDPIYSETAELESALMSLIFYGRLTSGTDAEESDARLVLPLYTQKTLCVVFPEQHRDRASGDAAAAAASLPQSFLLPLLPEEAWQTAEDALEVSSMIVEADAQAVPERDHGAGAVHQQHLQPTYYRVAWQKDEMGELAVHFFINLLRLYHLGGSLNDFPRATELVQWLSAAVASEMEESAKRDLLVAMNDVATNSRSLFDFFVAFAEAQLEEGGKLADRTVIYAFFQRWRAATVAVLQWSGYINGFDLASPPATNSKQKRGGKKAAGAAAGQDSGAPGEHAAKLLPVAAAVLQLTAFLLRECVPEVRAAPFHQLCRTGIFHAAEGRSVKLDPRDSSYIGAATNLYHISIHLRHHVGQRSYTPALEDGLQWMWAEQFREALSGEQRALYVDHYLRGSRFINGATLVNKDAIAAYGEIPTSQTLCDALGVPKDCESQSYEAVLVDLFGKNGRKLIPLLQVGRRPQRGVSQDDGSVTLAVSSSQTFNHFTLTPSQIPLLLELKWRLMSGEPVVVEGDTACGKSTLVQFFAQMSGMYSGTIVCDTHLTEDTLAERVRAIVDQASADNAEEDEEEEGGGGATSPDVLVILEEMNHARDMWPLRQLLRNHVVGGTYFWTTPAHDRRHETAAPRVTSAATKKKPKPPPKGRGKAAAAAAAAAATATARAAAAGPGSTSATAAAARAHHDHQRVFFICVTSPHQAGANSRTEAGVLTAPLTYPLLPELAAERVVMQNPRDTKLPFYYKSPRLLEMTRTHDIEDTLLIYDAARFILLSPPAVPAGWRSKDAVRSGENAAVTAAAAPANIKTVVDLILLKLIRRDSNSAAHGGESASYTPAEVEELTYFLTFFSVELRKRDKEGKGVRRVFQLFEVLSFMFFLYASYIDLDHFDADLVPALQTAGMVTYAVSTTDERTRLEFRSAVQTVLMQWNGDRRFRECKAGSSTTAFQKLTTHLFRFPPSVNVNDTIRQTCMALLVAIYGHTRSGAFIKGLPGVGKTFSVEQLRESTNAVVDDTTATSKAAAPLANFAPMRPVAVQCTPDTGVRQLQDMAMRTFERQNEGQSVLVLDEVGRLERPESIQCVRDLVERGVEVKGVYHPIRVLCLSNTNLDEETMGCFLVLQCPNMKDDDVAKTLAARTSTLSSTWTQLVKVYTKWAAQENERYKSSFPGVPAHEVPQLITPRDLTALAVTTKLLRERYSDFRIAAGMVPQLSPDKNPHLVFATLLMNIGVCRSTFDPRWALTYALVFVPTLVGAAGPTAGAEPGVAGTHDPRDYVDAPQLSIAADFAYCAEEGGETRYVCGFCRMLLEGACVVTDPRAWRPLTEEEHSMRRSCSAFTLRTDGPAAAAAAAAEPRVALEPPFLPANLVMFVTCLSVVGSKASVDLRPRHVHLIGHPLSANLIMHCLKSRRLSPVLAAIEAAEADAADRGKSSGFFYHGERVLFTPLGQEESVWGAGLIANRAAYNSRRGAPATSSDASRQSFLERVDVTATDTVSSSNAMNRVKHSVQRGYQLIVLADNMIYHYTNDVLNQYYKRSEDNRYFTVFNNKGHTEETQVHNNFRMLSINDQDAFVEMEGPLRGRFIKVELGFGDVLEPAVVALAHTYYNQFSDPDSGKGRTQRGNLLARVIPGFTVNTLLSLLLTDDALHDKAREAAAAYAHDDQCRPDDLYALLSGTLCELVSPVLYARAPRDERPDSLALQRHFSVMSVLKHKDSLLTIMDAAEQRGRRPRHVMVFTSQSRISNTVSYDEQLASVWWYACGLQREWNLWRHTYHCGHLLRAHDVTFTTRQGIQRLVAQLRTTPVAARGADTASSSRRGAAAVPAQIPAAVFYLNAAELARSKTHAFCIQRAHLLQEMQAARLLSGSNATRVAIVVTTGRPSDAAATSDSAPDAVEWLYDMQPYSDWMVFNVDELIPTENADFTLNATATHARSGMLHLPSPSLATADVCLDPAFVMAEMAGRGGDARKLTRLDLLLSLLGKTEDATRDVNTANHLRDNAAEVAQELARATGSSDDLPEWVGGIRQLFETVDTETAAAAARTQLRLTEGDDDDDQLSDADNEEARRPRRRLRHSIGELIIHRILGQLDQANELTREQQASMGIDQMNLLQYVSEGTSQAAGATVRSALYHSLVRLLLNTALVVMSSLFSSTADLVCLGVSSEDRNNLSGGTSQRTVLSQFIEGLLNREHSLKLLSDIDFITSASALEVLNTEATRQQQLRFCRKPHQDVKLSELLPTKAPFSYIIFVLVREGAPEPLDHLRATLLSRGNDSVELRSHLLRDMIVFVLEERIALKRADPHTFSSAVSWLLQLYVSVLLHENRKPRETLFDFTVSVCRLLLQHTHTLLQAHKWAVRCARSNGDLVKSLEKTHHFMELARHYENTEKLVIALYLQRPGVDYPTIAESGSEGTARQFSARIRPTMDELIQIRDAAKSAANKWPVDMFLHSYSLCSDAELRISRSNAEVERIISDAKNMKALLRRSDEVSVFKDRYFTIRRFLEHIDTPQDTMRWVREQTAERLQLEDRSSGGGGGDRSVDPLPRLLPSIVASAWHLHGDPSGERGDPVWWREEAAQTLIAAAAACESQTTLHFLLRDSLRALFENVLSKATRNGDDVARSAFEQERLISALRTTVKEVSDCAGLMVTKVTVELFSEHAQWDVEPLWRYVRHLHATEGGAVSAEAAKDTVTQCLMIAALHVRIHRLSPLLDGTQEERLTDEELDPLLQTLIHDVWTFQRFWESSVVPAYCPEWRAETLRDHETKSGMLVSLLRVLSNHGDDLERAKSIMERYHVRSGPLNETAAERNARQNHRVITSMSVSEGCIVSRALVNLANLSKSLGTHSKWGAAAGAVTLSERMQTHLLSCTRFLNAALVRPDGAEAERQSSVKETVDQNIAVLADTPAYLRDLVAGYVYFDAALAKYGDKEGSFRHFTRDESFSLVSIMLYLLSVDSDDADDNHASNSFFAKVIRSNDSAAINALTVFLVDVNLPEKNQRGAQLARIVLAIAALARTILRWYRSCVSRAVPDFTTETNQLLLSAERRESVYVLSLRLALPACPYCGLAYDRYDGCLAMRCVCGKSFCNACFEKCGGDAHPHASRCMAIPKHTGGYFASTENWMSHFSRVFLCGRVEALKKKSRTMRHPNPEVKETYEFIRKDEMPTYDVTEYYDLLMLQMLHKMCTLGVGAQTDRSPAEDPHVTLAPEVDAKTAGACEPAVCELLDVLDSEVFGKAGRLAKLKMVFSACALTLANTSSSVGSLKDTFQTTVGDASGLPTSELWSIADSVANQEDVAAREVTMQLQRNDVFYRELCHSAAYALANHKPGFRHSSAMLPFLFSDVLPQEGRRTDPKAFLIEHVDEPVQELIRLHESFSLSAAKRFTFILHFVLDAHQAVARHCHSQKEIASNKLSSLSKWEPDVFTSERVDTYVKHVQEVVRLFNGVDDDCLEADAEARGFTIFANSDPEEIELGDAMYSKKGCVVAMVLQGVKRAQVPGDAETQGQVMQVTHVAHGNAASGQNAFLEKLFPDLPAGTVLLEELDCSDLLQYDTRWADTLLELHSGTGLPTTKDLQRLGAQASSVQFSQLRQLVSPPCYVDEVSRALRESGGIVGRQCIPQVPMFEFPMRSLNTLLDDAGGSLAALIGVDFDGREALEDAERYHLHSLRAFLEYALPSQMRQHLATLAPGAAGADEEEARDSLLHAYLHQYVVQKAALVNQYYQPEPHGRGLVLPAFSTLDAHQLSKRQQETQRALRLVSPDELPALLLATFHPTRAFISEQYLAGTAGGPAAPAGENEEAEKAASALGLTAAESEQIIQAVIEEVLAGGASAAAAAGAGDAPGANTAELQVCRLYAFRQMLVAAALMADSQQMATILYVGKDTSVAEVALLGSSAGAVVPLAEVSETVGTLELRSIGLAIQRVDERLAQLS